ncbi:MAG: DUF393 domain-containing protein [Hyphomicrobiales bacterium]|nr:DUF393 domain-containing protein [Rickettsiales bacterium]MCP5361147.1 DUF393 domain-containing protein [Hyphomicrobiales bacterium]
MEKKAIILFDGVCNLCEWDVRFIIRRDPEAFFFFAPIQSSVGKRLVQKHGFTASDMEETFLLIYEETVLTRSDAVLFILNHLRSLWRVCYIFVILPRSWRDALYDWVARNRYHWFGKKEACMVPTPELNGRFLQDE